MTPLPKRRLSTKRQGKRRQSFTLSLASLIVCPNCKKPRLPHKACPSCGYYNGKLAKKIKEKKTHS